MIRFWLGCFRHQLLMLPDSWYFYSTVHCGSFPFVCWSVSSVGLFSSPYLHNWSLLSFITCLNGLENFSMEREGVRGGGRVEFCCHCCCMHIRVEPISKNPQVQLLPKSFTSAAAVFSACSIRVWEGSWNSSLAAEA